MYEEKEQFFYNCPICKSESAFIFTSKHGRKIYECTNKKCGHFFTPILNEAQGVCAREEDIEIASDKSLAIFNERNIRLLNLFKSYLKDVARPVVFLDFGAGNAHISRSFKQELKEECTIFCLEPNPLCKGLYEKYRLVQLINIEDIPSGINLIYMIEVIEHLDDPVSVLKTLRSSLASNGMLFLSTPLGSKTERSTNAYDTLSHIHFFTPSSLNLTLLEAGFSAIDFRYNPEMYPLPRNFLQKIISNTKLVIKYLLKISKIRKAKIDHLVGFTKSLN